MKITLTIEDTLKGIQVDGEYVHNGITDNGTQSLSAHMLARIATMLKDSQDNARLVVEGSLADI